jgi:alpha-L-rhamnosidase
MEDGSIRETVSDTTWRLTAAGPITANNEFDGERHDSRREMQGWDSPGFDDAAWMPCRRVAGPAGRLTGRPIAPMRVIRTLRPVRQTPGPKGTFVCDMGENVAGWARITLRRPRPGAVVRLRFAETLRPDGGLDTRNLRTAAAEDVYIARGDSSETWEPKFTIHGFRYVEVSAPAGCVPDSSAVEGRVVHDDVEAVGAFECSSPVVNRTFRNAVRGILGNYRSIPTDCPQRDERQGWLGDRLGSSLGESYVADVHALYAKWMTDIRDSQTEAGSIPDVAPAFWKVYSDNVSWPGVYVFLGDMLRVQYGDSDAVRLHYPAMAKWMEYMKRYLAGGLMIKDTYGDWCPPPESPGLIHTADPSRMTPAALIGTALYCAEAERMRAFAHLSGLPDGAQAWAGLAGRLREALNGRLWDPVDRTYGNGSVTSNLLPLGLGLAPDSLKPAVLERILERILGDCDGHTAAGLVGAQWLMRTLSRNGRPDVALRLAENTTYPSWGYMAEKGATTIWELWNGDTADPSMNSGNHVMLLGDFIPWLFEDVAGIRPDPLVTGFRHVLMRPMPAGGLTGARASLESTAGLIVSDWRLADGRFEWSIEVPPGAEATVFVPAAAEKDVREGKKPARKSEGVRFLRMEEGRAVYSVGSGKYRFTSASAAPGGPSVRQVSTPVVHPADTTVAAPGTARVRMECRTEGAEIRYTLDGSDPDGRSPLYEEPFETDSPILVSAAAFKPGLERSYVRRSRIDVYRPESHGLSVSLYEGFWTALPDFSRLRPRRAVSPAGIGLDAVPRPADGFGLVFTGFLNAPADGDYRFRLASDDGSRLLIDGRTVVSNDSTHAVSEASGTVRLAKGRHALRLEYFEGRGDESLRLDWEGPGLRTPRPLPRSVLSPR